MFPGGPFAPAPPVNSRHARISKAPARLTLCGPRRWLVVPVARQRAREQVASASTAKRSKDRHILRTRPQRQGARLRPETPPERLFRSKAKQETAPADAHAGHPRSRRPTQPRTSPLGFSTTGTPPREPQAGPAPLLPAALRFRTAGPVPTVNTQLRLGCFRWQGRCATLLLPFRGGHSLLNPKTLSIPVAGNSP